MKHILRLIPALLASLAAASVAFVREVAASTLLGPKSFRAVKTRDVSFQYRMGAGFPGDVNRMHPASILPGLLDPTNNFLGYGQVALFGDGTTGAVNTYRALVVADGSATPIRAAGIIVRPFPTQQLTGGVNATIGAVAPPTSGVADFLESGFIIVKGRAGMTVRKGGAVHVWAAATSGASIRGEFQSAASTTNTVTLANAMYNGPADADGNVEIRVWSAI